MNAMLRLDTLGVVRELVQLSKEIQTAEGLTPQQSMLRAIGIYQELERDVAADTRFLPAITGAAPIEVHTSFSVPIEVFLERRGRR